MSVAVPVISVQATTGCPEEFSVMLGCVEFPVLLLMPNAWALLASCTHPLDVCSAT